MKLSKLYDSSFYANHWQWRPEYEIIGKIINKYLDFADVIDFGCGNGFIISELHGLGKNVKGIDGSKEFIKNVPDNIKSKVSVANILDSFIMEDLVYPRDLVICTEVAEHIEKRFADKLVEVLTSHAKKWIFFSAATPGQGGHGHVNEQPIEYWIEKFAKHGFSVNGKVTSDIQRELSEQIKTIIWFPKNSYVFEKNL